MRPLTFNRKLKRNTRDKYFHPVVHRKQSPNKNWCWAASALMLNPGKANYWTLDTLVSAVLNHPEIEGKCKAKDCAVYIPPAQLSTNDLPLCQDCNLRMLNVLGMPKHEFESVGRLAFWDLFGSLIGHPVEAYVSPGPSAGTAHFLVIHGVFWYVDAGRSHCFVMLADPEEEGPGFCEYERFVQHGAYHSTSRFYEWSKTFFCT